MVQFASTAIDGVARCTAPYIQDFQLSIPETDEMFSSRVETEDRSSLNRDEAMLERLMCGRDFRPQAGLTRPELRNKVPNQRTCLQRFAGLPACLQKMTADLRSELKVA